MHDHWRVMQMFLAESTIISTVRLLCQNRSHPELRSMYNSSLKMNGPSIYELLVYKYIAYISPRKKIAKSWGKCRRFCSSTFDLEIPLIQP